MDNMYYAYRGKLIRYNEFLDVDSMAEVNLSDVFVCE